MKMNFKQYENVVEHDLVWLFCHSEGDCGIKSNWSAMVNASCFGSSVGYYDHINSFTLNSVEHYREVDKIYKSLTIPIQNILYASFADVSISANILKIFKTNAGAACCSLILNMKELDDLCKRVSSDKNIKGDKQLISEIRIETSKYYQEAILQYIKIKREFKNEQTKKTSIY